MPTLVSSGKDIGFTILPYFINTPVEDELLANPSDYVLGYITCNTETGKYRFTYTESGHLTKTKNHWSLSIIKEFPYCEQKGPWIVYNCSPEQTTIEFGKILRNSHETLHVDNWDIWSVEGKDSKVVVITSWGVY